MGSLRPEIGLQEEDVAEELLVSILKMEIGFSASPINLLKKVMKRSRLKGSGFLSINRQDSRRKMLWILQVKMIPQKVISL